MPFDRTGLTLETLTSVHAQARKMSDEKIGFPDTEYRRAKEVLRERGLQWAETVLLRSLPRPTLFRSRPGLNAFEIFALILADSAEWELDARNNEESKHATS